MSSMPQTPPDSVPDNNVQFTFDVPAFNALSEVPAVGAPQLKVENASKEGNERNFVEAMDASSDRRSPEGKFDDLDPLLLAAVITADPHLSHHHSRHVLHDGHEFGAHDWVWSDGQMVRSRQVPRNIRLQQSRGPEENDSSLSTPTYSPVFEPSKRLGRGAYSLPISPYSLSRESSIASSGESSPSAESAVLEDELCVRNTYHALQAVNGASSLRTDVQVKCMVRTRVPTPHGEVFLHLYYNDRDDKEHLAIVIDPAQLDGLADSQPHAPYIRSKSLDAIWENETEMDRVTRGAYVGRLSEAGYTVSAPEDAISHARNSPVPAPLVRIHSECFTGETIGSMRCDCGEQLDEAIRRIFQGIEYTDENTGATVAIPGRGAVIYMRQEGRGIGLLSKLRAYNLQDLGHDTVQANLMLGHGADERSYDVAAAIMHDLGLGTSGEGDLAHSGVRLLTNNPDKVTKLSAAGVHISEQVEMVPRAWRCQPDNNMSTHLQSLSLSTESGIGAVEERAACLRSAGATLIGGGVTQSPELEKYLRTKVLRMGHMLSLPSSEAH